MFYCLIYLGMTMHVGTPGDLAGIAGAISQIKPSIYRQIVSASGVGNPVG